MSFLYFTGVGSFSFLQGIFPTQGSNPGLPHCRQILYHLSHQGSARILEWVAYPFSRDLPGIGIEPGSPVLQANSLPAELQGSSRDKNMCQISLQKCFPSTSKETLSLAPDNSHKKVINIMTKQKYTSRELLINTCLMSHQTLNIT